MRIKQLLILCFLALVAVPAYSQNPAFSGYNRRNWPHWLDYDHDCQNTRAEILIYYSQKSVHFRSSRHCVVKSGYWFGVYTGRYFSSASQLQIDHVVPLRHAYGHGGAHWSRRQKAIYANDPENLLPVYGRANQSKGAKGPDEWRPPNHAFWCEYAHRWKYIKIKYHLRVDAPEKAAVNRMIAESCN